MVQYSVADSEMNMFTTSISPCISKKVLIPLGWAVGQCLFDGHFTGCSLVGRKELLLSDIHHTDISSLSRKSDQLHSAWMSFSTNYSATAASKSISVVFCHPVIHPLKGSQKTSWDLQTLHKRLRFSMSSPDFSRTCLKLRALHTGGPHVKLLTPHQFSFHCPHCSHYSVISMFGLAKYNLLLPELTSNS